MKRKKNKHENANPTIEELCFKKIEIEQEISELKSHVIIIGQQIDHINNNRRNTKFKVGFLFNRKENTVKKIRGTSSKKQKVCLRTLNKEMCITRKRISSSRKQLKQLCKVLYALEAKKVHATRSFRKTRIIQNQNNTLIINKG